MVSFAVTPDRRWRATTDELVTATRAVGFEGLGVIADRVDGRVARAFDEASLRCHEVLAVVVGEDDAETIEQAETCVVAAEQMHAEWVLTTFAVAIDAGVRRTIERCSEIFAGVGVGMAVEFSPYRAVATISDAADVVTSAETRCRAGMVIDTWHFSIGDSTWEDLASVPLDLIAYVQFTDALPMISRDVMDETMNRRAIPGEGMLELQRFASTLLDRGWDGLVSVEVLNAELLDLPTQEVVARMARATVPYWQ